MNYKTMGIDEVIEWCKENNQVEWLKKTAAKKYYTINKDTGEKKARKITFIELKAEFVDKFMPEIKPVAKPKKPTMYEMIEAL